MTAEPTYWQKELTPIVARLNGSTYEVYQGEFSRWEVADRNVGPDILYSGNWYRITEDEALKIIADFASGVFFQDGPDEARADG